ncbi:aspartic proteinase-like protein 2 [Quillaja saponaria]|uniref:Aspartic proteinase-like protein 2 n=1 Tax=Quillaja saponaria TaxID=32244 RepID=A0AAD7QEA9_QUISA|nr:aspartic proteinase-like protein 2 [Quillaja saponaria]
MEIMNTMIRSGSRVVVLGLLVLQFSWLAFGNFVIPVQHKFQGQERTLNALNAHDAIRHGRELSAVDMSMGGSLERTGCGAMVSGPQPHGLGLVGFGQDKTSLISQLASTGNVKKVFSHCLDSTKGGGIFAIGEVVQPIVKTTPIVDQFKYIIVANGVDVGGQVLQLPPEAFENGYGKDAMVDSGAALTFLPDNILEPLIAKIMAGKPGLRVFMNPGNFACFNYTGDIGYDEFPNVTFHFEGSLSLTIHPHNYILPNNEWNNVTEWCLGWRSGKDNSQIGLPEIILGEVALMDKLVLYDLEKQVIGWTQYNCSSSIKVREGSSGAVYSVNSHNIFQSTEH